MEITLAFNTKTMKDENGLQWREDPGQDNSVLLDIDDMPYIDATYDVVDPTAITIRSDLCSLYLEHVHHMWRQPKPVRHDHTSVVYLSLNNKTGRDEHDVCWHRIEAVGDEHDYWACLGVDKTIYATCLGDEDENTTALMVVNEDCQDYIVYLHERETSGKEDVQAQESCQLDEVGVYSLLIQRLETMANTVVRHAEDGQLQWLGTIVSMPVVYAPDKVFSVILDAQGENKVTDIMIYCSNGESVSGRYSKLDDEFFEYGQRFPTLLRNLVVCAQPYNTQDIT